MKSDVTVYLTLWLKKDCSPQEAVHMAVGRHRRWVCQHRHGTICRWPDLSLQAIRCTFPPGYSKIDHSWELGWSSKQNSSTRQRRSCNATKKSWQCTETIVTDSRGDRDSNLSEFGIAIWQFGIHYVLSRCMFMYCVTLVQVVKMGAGLPTRIT